MNQEQVNNILLEHKKWLENEEGGSCANFRGVNLRGVDLSETNLRLADLNEADLRKADLRKADLREANLNGADLRIADLRVAELSEAYLGGTDLRGADLGGADLKGADLREADLRMAYLRRADFSEADLRGANLIGVDLSETNLNGAKIFVPMACPSEGEFIGWKKVIVSNEYWGCKLGIAKLKIPQYAKRSSGTGRKCRASEVIVLDIIDIKSGNRVLEGHSIRDTEFIYRVGETVKPEFPFDENRWNECSSGIHFFITREEAEAY